MKAFLLLSILLIYRTQSFTLHTNDYSRSCRQSFASYALLPGRKLLKSSSASQGEYLPVLMVRMDVCIPPLYCSSQIQISYFTAGKISTIATVKRASSLIKKQPVEDDSEKEVESVNEQLKQLETAVNANRAEWEAQLKAKLGNTLLNFVFTERKSQTEVNILVSLEMETGNHHI